MTQLTTGQSSTSEMKVVIFVAFLCALAAAVDVKPPNTTEPIEVKPKPLMGDTGDASDTPSVEGGSSEEYRQLEPDEVKGLLLKVIDDYVDKDKDGSVTPQELQDWLKVLQEKVIQDNIERQWAYYYPEAEEADSLSWKAYYPEKKDVVTWERYKNMTYPDEALTDDAPATDEIKEIKSMIKRAERRWKNADADGDGNLSKEEFRDYIHPEESQKAAGVVVLEAMEDMDLDKNGEVSMEEYMTHLEKVSGPEKDDPNWAAAQQGHFTNYLDKDKDGSLSESEMREWVVPSYDRSEAEAWRLISIADADQDSALSREDIANYHEYFLTLLPPEYWVQEDPTESSRHDEF